MGTKATVRNNWLGLAGMFGLTVGAVAAAAWPWPLIMGVAMSVVVSLHVIRYRHPGRKIHGSFAAVGPGAGVAGSIFGAAALLIRGTPVANWAGPLLGLAAFAGMYLYLTRYGSFYPEPGEGVPESS